MALRLNSAIARSKFKGCMLGALLGDCLAAPFEGEAFTTSGKLMAQKYFDLMHSNTNVPFKQFTDDFALTRTVATALIEKHPINYEHMAKLMVTEYFTKPERGYGRSTAGVFMKLKASLLKDIYEPAKTAFEGHGSLGNGGAMRVAPIALYFNDDLKEMMDATVKSTKITHAHKEGINGALLQAIAVHQCFSIPPEENVSAGKFCEQLIEKIKPFETVELGIEVNQATFTSQLQIMLNILNKNYTNQQAQDMKVLELLGNTVEAISSVPTAIFCFLRAQKEIEDVKTDNVLNRIIQYAISLGGDTDTIGSMAGAMAGAHLGESVVNANLRKHAEDAEKAAQLADKLYEASRGRKKT